MALPTFLRHLDVLEAHGLISSEKTGRVRTCRLEPETLSRVDAWLTDRRALWNHRLDQLGEMLGEPGNQRRK
jgi:DNA-binding transcriptional ArsR family regulator